MTEGSVGQPVPSATPLDGSSRARRPDLVLLPGMLGDVTAWDGVAALLSADASIRTARLEFDDSVTGMAEGALAAAPPTFALAGHSLGAIVALEMVRRAPERVTRLALVNGSGRGPNPAQREAWTSMRERTEAGEFAAVVEELARTTLPPPLRDDAELVARNARMGHRVGADAFLRQLAAQAGRPDSLGSLPGFALPTLVVAGELDEVCPSARQREVAALVPGARLETLAGTGHQAPLENPAGLAALLRAWLLG